DGTGKPGPERAGLPAGPGPLAPNPPGPARSTGRRPAGRRPRARRNGPPGPSGHQRVHRGRPIRSGFLVVPLVGRVLGRPAFAQPAPKGDTNAAMKYWQAFGLMPTLTKDQETILHDWEKVPLDAAAQKLIDQSKNSLDYLHRGAKLDKCDWG